MSKIDWREILNWSEEQIDELRVTGYSYIRQGQYEIALPLFEALTVLDASKPYNWQTLGALYLELHEDEKAVKTLKHALQMAPQDGPTLLNYCKALFAIGDIKQGLEKAAQLRNHSTRKVSSYARALLLAYS